MIISTHHLGIQNQALFQRERAPNDLKYIINEPRHVFDPTILGEMKCLYNQPPKRVGTLAISSSYPPSTAEFLSVAP
jgi:hypothetical protein